MYSTHSSKIIENHYIFSCININGEKRVKVDLDIVCYEGEHLYWSLGVALPSLIVWGLGIPLFALGLLISHRDSLETLKTR